MLRLWEDRVDEIRPKIAAELREALAEFDGPDGVVAPASTWIIGARAPLDGNPTDGSQYSSPDG